MRVTMLRWAQLTPAPWRNGAGVTRELSASPPTAVTSSFDWRVSIADVRADGPFSAFPGVQRTITGIDGEGLLLTVDGTEHEVPRAVPFTFSGDTTTSCRLLSGPARALNVMTRRGRASAAVAVAGPGDIQAAEGETAVVVTVSGKPEVAGPELPSVPLGPGDAAEFTGPGTVTTTGGTVAVVRIVRISPRS